MIEIEIEISQVLQTVFKDPALIFDKSRFAGGLTNYNYLMDIGGKTYVVRQPGFLTDQIIDRSIEKENNSRACELGINSKCVFFDERTGIKISEYIVDSKNFAMANPYDFKQIEAVVKHIKQLHSSKDLFLNYFDFDSELNRYEGIVETLQGDLFFDYAPLKAQLSHFKKTHVKNTDFVPCHNDTVPENFLVDAEGKTYLIDWEYSGLNDSAWDLAAYILESRLPEESVNHFLTLYYGEEVSSEILIKIKYFMLAQDLLWTVWALIRHYGGDDFLDYCYMRYERFRNNMERLNELEHLNLSDLY